MEDIEKEKFAFRLIILGLIGFVFFFVFGQKAHGAVLAQQLYEGDSSSITSVVDGFYQSVGQLPSSTITSVDTYYQSLGTGYMTVVLCDNIDWFSTTVCTGQDVHVSDQVNTTSSDRVAVHFTFQGDPIVVDDEYVYILFPRTGAGVQHTIWGTHPASAYPNGECVKVLSGFSTSTCGGGMVDAFFIVNEDLSSSLAITFPINQSSISGNFDYWNVEANVSVTSTANLIFSVDYGTLPGVYVQSSTVGFSVNTGISGVINIPKVWGLSAGQTYFAVARVYADGVLLASSEMVTFSIGTGATINSFFDDSVFMDATGSSTPLTCTQTSSTFFGWDFGRTLCQVGATLFMPNGVVLQQFQSIPSMITTKVPFSYVNEILTAVQSYSTGTQAFPTVSLVMLSGENMNATNTMQVMFGTSTIDRYYSASLRNFVRSLILFLLYASCAVILWRQGEQFFK